MGLSFDGVFECSRNLTYFFSCVFDEAMFISSLIRRVVSAPERVLKNSSVEQILRSRKVVLKGMDCLV